MINIDEKSGVRKSFRAFFIGNKAKNAEAEGAFRGFLSNGRKA